MRPLWEQEARVAPSEEKSVLEMGLEWTRWTAASWKVETRLGVKGERRVVSESGEEVEGG